MAPLPLMFLIAAAASGSVGRTIRRGLSEGPDVPEVKARYAERILRKADIAAHAIRQVGDLVLRLTAHPDGAQQRTRRPPDAEFPVQFIDRRRKGINN